MKYEIKISILTLLSDKLSLCSTSSAKVHDFNSLKALIFNQEFEKEIRALISALDSDPQGFPRYFKGRCKARARQNAGTSLSLFALPQGNCNQLYISITNILFRPKTMGELLAYLEPDITMQILLNLDSASSSLDNNLKDPAVRLIERSTAYLTQEPTASELADFAVSGQYIFDLKTIAALTLSLHQSLYCELSLNYPDLTQQIYKHHNTALIALEEYIASTKGKGPTPLKIIRQFIRKSLFNALSSKNVPVNTTSIFPNINNPIQYLNAIDHDEKSAVLALTGQNGRKCLGEIIRLQGYGFIDGLQDIIENPVNQILLNQRPQLSAQHIQAINALDNSLVYIPAARDITHLPLPHQYLESNLSCLNIADGLDYINLLLSIPTQLYTSLMRLARIDTRIFFKHSAANRIQKIVLDQEQFLALNQALIANIDEFGGIHRLLNFAATYSHDLIQMVLETLPPEQWLSVLNTKDERAGVNTFQYATFYPPSFLYLLGLLPRNKVLGTLLRKDDSNRCILHDFFGKLTPTLTVILQVLPSEDHLAVARLENSAGHDLLCFVAPYPESLETVLRIYPEQDRTAAATREYSDGSTLLHFAARKSRESLQILRGYYPPEQWYAALTKQNNAGKTPLYYASDNWKIDVAEYIFQFIPKQNLLSMMLNTIDSSGNNLVCKAARLGRLCSILELLPIADGAIAVKETRNHFFKENIFTIACKDPRALQAIWNRYPKEERLAALLKKNSRFSSIDDVLFDQLTFHRIVPHHKSLKAMLDVIPDSVTQKKLVETENSGGQNALHMAVTNPQSLSIILNLYQPTCRAARLNLRDLSGNSAMDYAAKYPESMAIIAKCLPEFPSQTGRISFFSPVEASTPVACDLADSNIDLPSRQRSNS